MLWVAALQIYWEIIESVLERKTDEQIDTYDEHVVLNLTLNGTERIILASNGLEFLLLLMTWYVAIAIGSAAGAILNKLLKVNVIYVSILFAVSLLFGEFGNECLFCHLSNISELSILGHQCIIVAGLRPIL